MRRLPHGRIGSSNRRSDRPGCRFHLSAPVARSRPRTPHRLAGCLPGCAHVEQIHKESLVSSPAPGEDTVLGLSKVGIQDSQPATRTSSQERSASRVGHDHQQLALRIQHICFKDSYGTRRSRSSTANEATSVCSCDASRSPARRNGHR